MMDSGHLHVREKDATRACVLCPSLAPLSWRGPIVMNVGYSLFRLGSVTKRNAFIQHHVRVGICFVELSRPGRLTVKEICFDRCLSLGPLRSVFAD